MKKTKTMVITSLLIALTVVLARFASIKTEIVRISIEFLPIALSAVLSGPIIGGITGAIADVVGFFSFPVGTFFPGFTISAFVSGLIYGLFLYKKEITTARTVITVIVKVIIVDLILVTAWLMILYKTPLNAIIVTRLIKCGVLLPVEFLLIYFGIRPLKNILKKTL